MRSGPWGGSIKSASPGDALLPQTVALLAAMSVQPSAERTVVINTLYSALIGAGILGKFDCFYALAAHDAQAARLNWINPTGSFNLTAVNAPVFTVDQGYQGNGVDTYLDPAFDPTTAPSPQFVQDSAHMSFWSRTAGQSDNREMGNGNAHIRCRSTTDNTEVRINTGIGGTTAGGSILSGLGLWTLVRTGAADTDTGIYVNGALVASTGNGPSQAPSATGIRILQRNGSTFSIRQCAMASIGAGLTAGEALALYNAVNAYKASVGF
jgi:hypothetical protein